MNLSMFSYYYRMCYLVKNVSKIFNRFTINTRKKRQRKRKKKEWEKKQAIQDVSW